MFLDNDVEKSFVEELKNNSWELKDEKLVKLFQFPSFIGAIDFVNEIAIIAERLITIQLLQLIGKLLNFP